MSPLTETTANELRERLDDLYAELALAGETDLKRDGSYMRDLCNELDEVRAAWTLAAVMQKALARARVAGALQG